MDKRVLHLKENVGATHEYQKQTQMYMHTKLLHLK